MRPTLPDVSGSASANAPKNAHPTQSAVVRVGLALTVVRLMVIVAPALSRGRHCTSAIEPVTGVGFALNPPVDAMDEKYPAI